MKKFLMGILTLLLVTGCTDMMNTPTKRTEEFLGRYQNMHSDVLNQLDATLDAETTLGNNQRNDYRDLMKKQYQNLAYKVKNETIDGDTANVEVEIEVYDYNSAVKKADKYLESNKEEFFGDNKVVDEKKFMDYKIKQMKDVKEKVKYTINFTLTKKDKKWVMDNITEAERLKLHGLYNY